MNPIKKNIVKVMGHHVRNYHIADYDPVFQEVHWQPLVNLTQEEKLIEEQIIIKSYNSYESRN